MKISKIIHQISLGDVPYTQSLEILSETWRYDYPDWEYILWDENSINTFIQQYFPQYWNSYKSLPYDTQRHDVICYLILYQMGGMYINLDYESIRPLNALLKNKECCFSQEPIFHYHEAKKNKKEYAKFNNAMIMSVPNHPFVKQIIQFALAEENINKRYETETETILRTTGVYILNHIYRNLTKEEKRQIYLIPPKYVSPFDFMQSQQFRGGVINSSMELYLEHAYAMNYFLDSSYLEKKEV